MEIIIYHNMMQNDGKDKNHNKMQFDGNNDESQHDAI